MKNSSFENYERKFVTKFCVYSLRPNCCWGIWEPPGDGGVNGDLAKTRRGLFMAGPTDISSLIIPKYPRSDLEHFLRVVQPGPTSFRTFEKWSPLSLAVPRERHLNRSCELYSSAHIYEFPAYPLGNS